MPTTLTNEEGNIMKLTTSLTLAVALSVSSLAFAQTDAMKDMDTKNMDMKDMDAKQCKEMMEMMGMKDMKDMKDMKGMDSKTCVDMMKNMDKKTKGKAAKAATHEAVAVVKSVDAANGKVTLSHEPIKSLNWPAMTMAFAVKDKTLLEKLTVGNKVDVEFKKQDSDYVITKVK
jgi:Cu(I)/Ag(I) efflux system protein CusF